ncbi:MAG: DUF2079 domain-containing protein [Patescibacteria group bacterium]
MNTRHVKILSISVAIYIIFTVLLSYIKYSLFLYNGLDLAIFTNILTQFTQNFDLYSTIQGHSYLGDHITPIILVLAPLFTIAPHAMTLLIIQSIVLGGSAFFVYKVVEAFFDYRQSKINKSSWALALSIAWLLNPLVWNTNLFEFHLIPLALPFLFAAFYFYLKQNFNAFLLSLLCACLVREDVSLIVIMFGIVAWIEKKSWKYRLAPIILGLLYFIIAFSIHTTHAESFRFFTYYAWLGDTPLAIITTLLTRPDVWLGHIISLPVLDMFVGLLFPFAFLPLRKPKYILLALFPLGQFLLGSSGGSNIIVQTHYSVLFLPALLFASLDGLQAIYQNKSRIYKLVTFDTQLSKIIGIVFVLATFVALSPIGYAALQLDDLKKRTNYAGLIHYTTKDISHDTFVVSTYDALPALSNRTNIYTLHYIFLGAQQFSEKPYILDTKPQTIFLDTNDLVTYQLQLYKFQDPTTKYHQGIKNIQNILSSYTPTLHPKGISVWQYGGEGIPLETFPTQDGCDVVSHGLGNTYSCVITEPYDAVYFLSLHTGQEERIVPFIWRDYREESQKAYARFYIKHNDLQENPTLNIITREGHIELGVLLSMKTVETTREVIRAIDLDFFQN